MKQSRISFLIDVIPHVPLHEFQLFCRIYACISITFRTSKLETCNEQHRSNKVVILTSRERKIVYFE